MLISVQFILYINIYIYDILSTIKRHERGEQPQVLFLCTCNQLDTIDRPLLDRMEIIELSGYTMEEKCHIASTHLLPKQRRVHGLEEEAEEAARLGVRL